MKFTDDDKRLARRMLADCPLSRDRLPYTVEFESLYHSFTVISGKQIGRDVFWRLLSSAAKLGGLAKRRKPNGSS